MNNKKKNKLKKSGLSPGNKSKIYILLLILIPFILYFRVVTFGLSGQDDTSIIFNINNKEGGKINPAEAFTHDAIMSNKGDTFYRPMQILSLMIDAEIGGTQPLIYHLSNLLLHLLTVLALFFFLKEIGIKGEFSFLLSLFFSVSPIFANAVVWIPARGDLLLCLFSLLSFITFIKYINSRKLVYFIIHGIVICIAAFSKETAVLLPILILLYFYYAARNKFIIKDIIPILIMWIFVFGFFFFMRFEVIKLSHPTNVFGIVSFIRNLPVIPITFGKFFIPLNLCTMPFFDDVSIIMGAVLIIVITFIIIKFIPGDKRIIIWGALWFLAFSFPPMIFRSYFSKIGYEYFDYRAYLPMAGIMVITGILLKELSVKFNFSKILIFIIPLLLVYSILSFIYSNVFANPVSFFTSAIEGNPGNALAYCQRGVAYTNEGNIEKALSDFDKSINSHPEYSVPYFNAGVNYKTLNDHSKAENYFSLALNYDTLSMENNFLKENIFINLGLEEIYLGKFDEAIRILRQGLVHYPGSGSLHNNLGLAYYSIARFDSALYEYNKGVESEKNSPKYYNNRGMAKYHLNDFGGASEDFSKALELKPDFPDALGNRGMVKIRINNNEGAISDLNTAINMDPKIGAMWYYRGLAYFKLNRSSDAKSNFDKAVELGYKGKEYGK